MPDTDGAPIGNCSTAADPDIFSSPAKEDQDQAILICLGPSPRYECTVRAACLVWALVHDERTGVWGGMRSRARGRFREGVAA